MRETVEIDTHANVHAHANKDTQSLMHTQAHAHTHTHKRADTDTLTDTRKRAQTHMHVRTHTQDAAFNLTLCDKHYTQSS